jgi:hypothetical protein
MPDRQATFFVCDDVLIALNGKFTISGLYTGDIIIAQSPAQLLQLVVMFEIKTPTNKPFQKLILQVLFPNDENPRQLDMTAALPAVIPVLPDRTTAVLRLPFLIQSPVLTSGAIEAKVIHEEGELSAGKQWITTFSEAQANAASLAKRA